MKFDLQFHDLLSAKIGDSGHLSSLSKVPIVSSINIVQYLEINVYCITLWITLRILYFQTLMAYIDICLDLRRSKLSEGR
jgi:hypothetical protein